jgi:hypothetical protein
MATQGISLGKYSFHTASILYSGNNPNLKNTSTLEENTEKESSTHNSIESQLKERSERLLQDERNVELTEEQDTNLDNFSSLSIFTANSSETSLSDWDSYPWFRADSIGSMHIPHNPLRLFDSVRILRLYLQLALNIDTSNISNGTLTRILEPFNGNGTITLQEFLDHISNLHAQDPNFISNINPSESANDSSETINNPSETLNTSDNVVVPRPLGPGGDITLNEIFTMVQNLEWPRVIESINIIGVQPLDIIVNTIPYSLMLRGFVNHVHRRPYPANMAPELLHRARAQRRVILLVFAFVGAPLILSSLRFASIS